MYTRIPNEKEENILRVRGQESWASTMLIGSIHDSNILIESILIGSIRIGSILIGTSESVAYSIQSDALEKYTKGNSGKRCTGKMHDRGVVLSNLFFNIDLDLAQEALYSSCQDLIHSMCSDHAWCQCCMYGTAKLIVHQVLRSPGRT